MNSTAIHAIALSIFALSDQPPTNGVLAWLDREFAGNSVRLLLIAAIVAVAAFFGFLVLRSLLISRVKKAADGSKNKLDDLLVALLADVRKWFIFVAAFYSGTSVLTLSVAAAQGVKLLFVVCAALQLLISSRLVIDYAITSALSRSRTPTGEPDPSIASASGIIRFIATLVLGVLLVLLAMTNMGVQITPLLTGLGIGGIAVALAAQSILGDLFSSLTIVFDKPFLVGDFIIVGDKMGVVEKIGVKTTRVRALSGEQLVFANSDLLSSRIQNYKRMQERRVVGLVNVVYETPAQKLPGIPAIIREAIQKQGSVRFDRAHFKALSTYSLDFEYVYYVLSADYNTFMDIQQSINLELFNRFQAEGLSFAYPTAVEIRRQDT